MEKIEQLKSDLQILENVRLPRLLERIEELKSKIVESEKKVETKTDYANRRAALTDEQKATWKKLFKSKDSAKYSAVILVLADLAKLDLTERERNITIKFSKGAIVKEIAAQENLSYTRILQIQNKVRSKVYNFYRGW